MGFLNILVPAFTSLATLFIGYYLGSRWKTPMLANPISTIKNEKYGDNKLLFRVYNRMDRDIHITGFDVEERYESCIKIKQYIPVEDGECDSKNTIKFPAVITVKANGHRLVELDYKGEYGDDYGLKSRKIYQRKGTFLILEFIDGKKQVIKYL